VSDGLLAALLLAAFLTATILGDALKPRWAWIPMALLTPACAAVFLELARYDHGHADLLTWVGFVGAPVCAILGGAAWRFYGWPDLGPHPSRLALVSAAVLVGVLVGSRVREQDIEVSKARAEALRAEWQATGVREIFHKELPHRSRMGLIDPPRFALSTDAKGRTVIWFPISARSALALGEDDGRWDLVKRGEQGGP
jgi:hypothetical protein